MHLLAVWIQALLQNQLFDKADSCIPLTALAALRYTSSTKQLCFWLRFSVVYRSMWLKGGTAVNGMQRSKTFQFHIFTPRRRSPECFDFVLVLVICFFFE